MNWGTKLVIGMALFMSFIVALGARMIFSSKDDLVDRNYYEKGLNYDQEYEEKQNVLRDKAEPALRVSPGTLQLEFRLPANGTATLAHPSDKSLEHIFSFAESTGPSVEIATGKLPAGQWHLRLSWESKGQKYLFEKVVHLQ